MKTLLLRFIRAVGPFAAALAVILVLGAAADIALAQPGTQVPAGPTAPTPPTPSKPDEPPAITTFAVLAVLVGLVLFASLLPVKRGHQD